MLGARYCAGFTRSGTQKCPLTNEIIELQLSFMDGGKYLVSAPMWLQLCHMSALPTEAFPRVEVDDGLQTVEQIPNVKNLRIVAML